MLKIVEYLTYNVKDDFVVWKGKKLQKRNYRRRVVVLEKLLCFII